jgi:hypothetical protein
MKQFIFDDFVKEKRTKFFALRAKLGLRRMPRRRPRSPEKSIALTLMDKARWEHWVQEGKIIEIGPRRYVINL